MNKIKLKTLTITNIEYNEDLVGYILTLYDKRTVQIQFDFNFSRSGLCAVIDKQNNYDLDITEAEEIEIIEFIKTNTEILEKAEDLYEKF